MKHLTTLLLTLLVSGGLWANDEFPIKLTCEFGAVIVYFNLEATEEGSWWEAEESTEFGRPGNTWHVFGDERYRGKYSKWDNYEVGKYIIKGEVKNWASSTRFEINRKSLGFYIYSNHSKHAGQCYKGFKEYEEQI